jgi:hypothetical protein
MHSYGFKIQKVYFSRLMRVYVGLIMLAAYFCHSYTFCNIKSLEHLKILKTGRVLYFGIELIIHVIKRQIHLVRQSL